MALRLIEGFELGDPDVGFVEGGTVQINTVNVRAGSGARYLDLTDSQAQWHTTPVGYTNAQTLYLGFAVRIEDTLGGGSFVMLSLGVWETGFPAIDNWVSLTPKADGMIAVNTCATPLSSSGLTHMFDTAAGVLVANTWHYLELKFLAHQSAGDIELWVDGVSVGSSGAVDTMAQSSGAPDLVQIQMQTVSADIEYDDIYILDTDTTSPETGTSPNITRLGDIVIEALAPTSDAVPNNFTRSAGANNWELVDEVPPDDDTTYVESSTAAHEDRYGLSNRVHTGTVFGVNVQVKAEKTDANARTLDIGLTSNAGATVDAQPVNMLLANGTYAVGQKTYDRDFHDEVTAADWTNAKVNALETSTVVV